MMLTKQELKIIREHTVFDEDNMKWLVPYFYMKPKEVALPSIGMSKPTVVVESTDEDGDDDRGYSPIKEYSNYRET